MTSRIVLLVAQCWLIGASGHGLYHRRSSNFHFAVPSTPSHQDTNSLIDYQQAASSNHYADGQFDEQSDEQASPYADSQSIGSINLGSLERGSANKESFVATSNNDSPSNLWASNKRSPIPYFKGDRNRGSQHTGFPSSTLSFSGLSRSKRSPPM